MRASRLGVNSPNLYIFAENNLSIIEAHLEKINPDLIIVDSIQTVYSPEYLQLQVLLVKSKKELQNS